MTANTKSLPDTPCEIELIESSCPDGWVIGRKRQPPYTEFWNPQCWAGSGYVFIDHSLAIAVRNLLVQATFPEPASSERDAARAERDNLAKQLENSRYEVRLGESAAIGKQRTIEELEAELERLREELGLRGEMALGKAQPAESGGRIKND